MNLNTFQIRAVEHKDGPVLVLAGPGSGKTAVITQRVRHLIKYHNVPEEKILVLTFTRAAAREMKQRFVDLCGEEQKEVVFVTIHALCYDILREWKHRNRLNILTNQEKEMLLRKLRYQYLHLQEGDDMNAEMEKKLQQLLIKEKKNQGYYELEDLVTEAYRILESHEEFRLKWQKRFDYYMIDEFQDTSLIQGELLFMLARRTANIMVVGDDDQSIYGFRGATPQIFQQFKECFEQAETIQLKVNYRSQERIIRLAEAVIRNNKERLEKDPAISGCISNSALESYPVITLYDNQWVQMKSMIDEMKRLKGEEYIPYEEMAVLFRTGQQFREFCLCADIYGIPVCCKEHSGSFILFEELISYLKVVINQYKRSDLLHVMNAPNREISRVYLEGDMKLEQWASHVMNYDETQGRCISVLKHEILEMRRLPPYLGLCKLYYDIGFWNYGIEYGGSHDICKEFIEDMLRSVLIIAKESCNYQELLDKLHLHSNNSQEQGVYISTMHGSKGLEFDTVFLPDLNEDVIPNRKAVQSSMLEEERRVFFVALTRAKNRLYLSYVRRKNNHPVKPSEFIHELVV